MRAILLAAGEGSRLRPLTASVPKPMVRVANKPVMQYAMEALVGNGVTDITIVAGYHREKVQSHFGDGNHFGCRLRYAFQDALIGTAHALAQVDFQDPVLVLGADNIVDERLIADLLKAREAHPDDVVLVAKRSDTPSKYGVLTLDGDRVKRIEEKPLQSTSEVVNTGVYAFPAGFQDVLQREVKQGNLGLTSVLDTVLAGGGRVVAARSTGTWMDAVYPWDVLAINAHLLADACVVPDGATIAETAQVVCPALVAEDAALGPQAALLPTTVVGENVTIGAGCIIENSVLMDDVQVGPGAIIRNSIIAEGVRIGPRFTALSGPCEPRLTDGYHDLKDFGCVVGPDAMVGGSVTIEPGVLVGERARVGTGAVVRRNVEDEERVV